ncbi:MAG: GDP-mannose 4,6-dehydratase [Anaerolineales bacterium]|nr:GDP-mannose 4,6-dehydratase [Anaerolineales bacterium]MBS3753510.1 GDP-mannose 4,6-dehydratase [Anaerolineales bacterium]
MKKRFLVTGGAGFIGTNYVARLLERGEEVIIYDNLSRRGTPRNVAWLERTYGEDSFQMVVEDVRNPSALTSLASDVDVIVHLASQVAVTTSVTHPREDFEINAQGTFNVLDAARLSERKPAVIYSSTNKVYGEMEELEVEEGETAYRYKDLPHGVSEAQPLDFHSPYGCSKGAGDQYVRDFHRMYNVPTVVFRQSCIYGPHQFGIEDQGWVAWFVIAAMTDRPITIYGDGKQVRDVLFVGDLLDAYDLALENLDAAAGQIYNVGGGPDNTLSIWKEFGPLLEEALEKDIQVTWEDWRPGDQRVFIADIRKAQKDLGWSPSANPQEGINQLIDWVRENRDLF